MKIYRSGTEVYDVEINESTTLNKKLMGVDIIKAQFDSTVMLDLRTNDYVIFNGVHYKINILPEVTKTSTRGYSYQVNLEGLQYEMSEVSFLNNSRPDVPLYSDADTMIAAVVINLNRVNNVWSKTVVPATEFKSITFGGDNCLSALNKICQEFKLEWFILGHELNVVSAVGNATGLTFEYKVGLKNIVRVNANKGNLVTRLYAFGGTTNVDYLYRSALGRLGLDAPLENNVSLYGVKEGTIIYEEIYPQRTGTVTSLGATITEFIDSSMDFDLNSYLLPGMVAKVVFKSGYLSGYLCEITAYDNATKKFTVIPYNDPAGFTLPAGSQIIQAGDTYTLVDIKMPDTYKTAAETLLYNTALADVLKVSVPRVTYNIVPDWRYFKANTISLNVGDTLTVHDTDMSSTDIASRVIELTQVLISPYKYTIAVSDEITYSIAEILISGQRQISNLIRIAGLQDAVRSRASYMDTQALRNAIFDPDNYFNMDKIRPGSIETMILSVGSKGSQFILKDVTFTPNFEGDKAKFNISTGSLVHLAIDPDAIKTWTIGAFSTAALDDAIGYYIYVKASKTLTTAAWEVTDTQYKTDPGGDYYYFLVGYLHLPSVNNMRRISLTYGSTNITGEFITTGKIISADGLTYFDLQNSEIGGRIKFQSGNYDDEIEATLSRKGRTFISTPTTPYNLGDLWSTGNNLYQCTTARATGAYASGDWSPATNYDKTQTIINGGIITSGRLEVGGGAMNTGNAWISGAVSGTPDTDLRFGAGATWANRANVKFSVQNDGKIKATYGTIGGWNLAADAIYTGIKSLANGFSSLGITLGADGSLHAQSFYINSNGEIGVGALGSLALQAVTAFGLITGLKIQGSDIWENVYDGDSSGVYINRIGHLGTIDHFRNFHVFNGKGYDIFTVFGILKRAVIYGDLVVDLADGGSTPTSIRFPNMNTAGRNAISSPQPGIMIFNTQTNQFEVFKNDSVWSGLTTH